MIDCLGLVARVPFVHHATPCGDVGQLQPPARAWDDGRTAKATAVNTCTVFQYILSIYCHCIYENIVNMTHI